MQPKTIGQYCSKYNIPPEHLVDVLVEPKVVPMIRGKAFEFSAMKALAKILDRKKWKVEKVPMNAQQGIHDIDVSVTHIPSQKAISIECKLTAKESFRKLPNGDIQLSVKCMRSRTLGQSMVTALAPRLHISPEQLSVHNDQYLPGDFDLVVTSIANAFYRTDPKTGIFEWSPNNEEIDFLISLGRNPKNLQDFAFNKIFIAKASALVINEVNKNTCTRRRCSQQKNCGFIPNYPIIKFLNQAKVPDAIWFPLEDCENLLVDFVSINNSP